MAPAATIWGPWPGRSPTRPCCIRRNSALSDPRKFLLAFGAASLASVGAGCWIGAAHGVPAGVWARDLAAWAFGLAVAALMARTAGERAGAGLLLATLAGLLVTLLSPGLSGVHRWIQLGPVRLNAAEVLAPGAVVALALLAPGRRWPWLAAAAIGAVLITQPDASQATAFGAATIAALLLAPAGRGLRWSGIAVAAVAIAAAWLRPDPLAPVPEVEQIFQLGWGLSPVVAILAGALLAATVLTPSLVTRSGESSRRAAFALIVYLAVSALAPALGAFPAPLVGIGVSPILGWWLGAGLLAALASGGRTSAPTP